MQKATEDDVDGDDDEDIAISFWQSENGVSTYIYGGQRPWTELHEGQNHTMKHLLIQWKWREICLNLYFTVRMITPQAAVVRQTYVIEAKHIFEKVARSRPQFELII